MTMATRWRLFARLRAFLRPHEVEHELTREIDAHVTLLQDELERRGLSPDEARRAARLALGGAEQTKERHRDERSLPWLEDLRRDVPYAVRGLRRNPAFTLAAVLTLALGIGAATAVYSIVGTILLVPLPYPESERLVRLSERVPPAEAGHPVGPRSITHDEFLEWRTRTTTLATMVATLWDPQVMVSTPQGAARLSGGLVSPEWFELLGARAMLGRTLQPNDVAEHRDVVVLSARAWRQYFGSDPQVIGRSITLQSRVRSMLNERPMEVVGVMPDGFEDPSGDNEFWTPMVMGAAQPGDSSPGVGVMGRLEPGVTIAAAEEEATAIGTALRSAAGAANAAERRQIEVIRLKDVRLSRVHTGYDPSNVLAFQLVLPEEYPTARKTDVMEAILARVPAAPGVEAAGFSYAGALVGIVNTVGYFVPPGRSADEIRERRDHPYLRSVSHDYLPAMGVRILDGRGFTARDEASAPWVVLINRTLARKYFGDVSPVGATLAWHGGPSGAGSVPVEVVGVVDDVRHGRIDQEPSAQVFIDYRQLLAIQERWGMTKEYLELHALGFMSFAARTAGDPAALGPAVRSAVRAADRNAGIDAMAPLERLMSSSIARPRFYAVLLGIFAAVAGFLALVGIYGVMGYAVLRRTKEIGVRMALGAEPRAVLALVLRHGFAVTAIGIGVGLAGAIALSRYLSTLLFGLTPLDPITYVFVAVGFAAVAILAAYLPARRAMRVDPAVALRCD